MKRFYTSAAVKETGRGFEIVLDTRPVRTPGKQVLTLPHKTVAEAVAAEWAAQGEKIDPARMPFTRFANTVIDRIAGRRDEVVDEIAGYGASDLLCYRADGPDSLVERQALAWNPLLDWLEKQYSARLVVTSGIVHVSQDPGALAQIRDAVASCCDYTLASLHTITTISGSVVIGLAVIEGELEAEQATGISTIDETFQAERWGEDAEALQRLAARSAEISQAAQFRALFRENS